VGDSFTIGKWICLFLFKINTSLPTAFQEEIPKAEVELLIDHQ
jgi:hypothetical protein